MDGRQGAAGSRGAEGEVREEGAKWLTQLRRTLDRAPRCGRSPHAPDRAVGAAIGKSIAEPGDRLGVDRIVLRQPPRRLGEMANPFRVDDENLEPGRAQRFRPTPLIAAARLHHRPADLVRAQLGNQLRLALRSARRRQAQPRRTNAGLDFHLRDIDADNAFLLWHTPTPFLARAGSHALATVRADGRHRTCPLLPRRMLLWCLRAQVRRRAAACNSRPFDHFLTNRGHKVSRPRRDG